MFTVSGGRVLRSTGCGVGAIDVIHEFVEASKVVTVFGALRVCRIGIAFRLLDSALKSSLQQSWAVVRCGIVPSLGLD